MRLRYIYFIVLLLNMLGKGTVIKLLGSSTRVTTLKNRPWWLVSRALACRGQGYGAIENVSNVGGKDSLQATFYARGVK